MNSQEKEKWVDEVLHCMKGSQRARPRPEVFTKIQNQLIISESKVVPIRKWRYAAAAAILILIVNVFALQRLNQSVEWQNSEMVTESGTEYYSHCIVSNFKIYE